MESGAENRSRLKKHVRAAREWLGHAEDSLDRREDVRGDLDLMLARAELARAQETEEPSGSVLWARRVLPLAAALFIAAGGWLLWRDGEPRTIPTRPRDTAGIALPAQAPATKGNEEVVAAAPIAPPAAMPEEPVVGGSTEPDTASADVPEPSPAHPEAEETVPEVFPPPQTVSIPSEEMQRLMSSAGQSLRAQ